MSTSRNSPIANAALHHDHTFDEPLIRVALEALRSALHDPAELVPADATTTLPQQLPRTGVGAEAALRALSDIALTGAARLQHRGYFAHMDPPTATVTWLAAMWQAAMNQNQLHPDVAPNSRPLEARLIEWIAPYFAMHGGHLVAGSTLANLTALWAARNLRGIRRVVASDRSHLSLRKAADMLGLEYVQVASNAEHQMVLSAEADYRNAVVVLTAGTVATGAIDQYQQRNCGWLHIDAAWGGPLRFSERHAPLLTLVNGADSVGFSAHKWCFQPKGTAVILFADADAAHASMSYGGGYLSAPNIGVAGSTAATAVPFAASLLAWGQQGLAERVELGMSQTATLTELIRRDSRFELWGEPTTGIVVWRPVAARAADVRAKLRDAWVSLTDIDGDLWLRSVPANLSADAEHVFSAVVAALD